MGGELDPEIAAKLDEVAERIFGKGRADENQGSVKTSVISTAEGNGRSFAAMRDVNIYIQHGPTPFKRSKSPDWRMKRIAAIQAVCTKRGWQDWRRSYISQYFGCTSMVDMPHAEIEQLYRVVMSKEA